MSRHGNRQGSDKRGRKPGRPTVMESRGDPKLPTRAAELRSLGLSWSQIASRLGVGRTTARRLVLLCQKDEGSQTRDDIISDVPQTNDDNPQTNDSQCVPFEIKEDVLERLPKTFRIFASLVRRAREMH